MRIRIVAWMLCSFMMILMLSNATAEENHVSIADLHTDAPERFQGEYVTQQGAHVSIDCAVIIPNVDACPIVRVTWGGPMELSDPALTVTTNDENVLRFDHGFEADAKRVLAAEGESVNSQLSYTDAASLLSDMICNAVPMLDTQKLQCINQLGYRHGDGEGGYYMVFFASLYHGIPYLCNAPYAIPLSPKDATPIPFELTYGCIEDSQHYNASVSVPKEIGVIEDDIPLLPFHEIQKIIEERIVDGYIASLEEMRFGYRIYIDPEYRGTEYILAPIWVFSGNMRASLEIPFEDDEQVVFMQFKRPSSFAINAQTGEIYTFVYEDNKNRQDVPHIVTWNEVK